ncbi:MAG: DUF5685 family protein [Lachnospiraceae bacterium]|nr:DUF5685 family protein [Lachnospiraceae bacterium]
MFGYVIVNKQELKFREFDRYRSYYCGLCRSLRENHGGLGQLSLSYDMTFVIMLLTALYEPETAEGLVKCAAHPFEKHPTRRNRFTYYAADMNLLLTYEKCLDDWKDERKVLRRLYAAGLKGKKKRIEERYPKKAETIREALQTIQDYEVTREVNIDLPAGAFGTIMAEILAYDQDPWEKELRAIGFYLGKFIYIMDAFDDLEKDRKSGSYNPLLLRSSDEVSLTEDTENMLVMMMGECCRAFERLPIVSEDAVILRNILYSGVFGKFRLHQAEKTKGSRSKGKGEI